MIRDFCIGAAGYPLIELVWRGHTHPAMALAGGLGLCALRRIDRMMKGRPLWQPTLLGGLAITGIEYAAGRVFNRRYQIWDYRRIPLNVQGQVCIPYTAAWCVISAAALGCMRYSCWSRMVAMRLLALPSP